jgi:hypothetical protein
MIVTVGVISLLTFAVSAVIAVVFLERYTEHLHAKTGQASPPTEIGKTEIGIVDQVTFESDHRLEVWQAAKTTRLKTYGWVDRGKGIIHMPIDRAMDEVLRRSGGGR